MNRTKGTYTLLLLTLFTIISLFPYPALAADTTPPAISIPLNSSYTAGDYYTVNVIVTDYGSGVESKQIYFDNKSVYQDQRILLEEGYHAVRVVATDKAGNQNTKQATFYAEAASSSNDTTPPTISIPLSSSYKAGDYYTVNVTVTDSQSGVASTSIYFDNSPVNNGQSIKLTEGYHAVRVVAKDNDGNQNEKQVTLYAEASTPNDTTPPSISIPLNSSYRAGDVYTVNVTVTDSGSGVASTTIYFDNSVVSQGQNITLTAGYHAVRVVARDNAGNQAEKQCTLYASQTDTTPPTITIPLASNYYAGDTYVVNVNVTDSGSGVDTVTIKFDNSTVNQGQSIILTAGTHTIYVTARDKAGNQAQQQASLVANVRDTTPPTISIPLGSNYKDGDYYTVNVIVTDTGSGVDTFTIYFDNSVVTNGQSIRLTSGTHTIRVTARDKAGNEAQQQATMNVSAVNYDTTPPNIEIPLNNSYSAGDIYYVNVIVTDTQSGVASTSIYFDNSTVSQGQAITLTAGSHTIRVEARDNAGNQAQKQVTLQATERDTTPPSIDIPLGSNYKDGDNYTVYVIVTDSGSGVDSYTIYFDNNVVNNGQVIRLTKGDHSIRVVARDKAGNQAQEQKTLHVGDSAPVDDTPPAISIPLNTPYYEGDTYVVNVIVQDFESGVASTNIYFDNNTVSMGQSIILTSGTHTIRVTARDNAGNESQKQASFQANPRDSSRPYVISTSPAQNSTGIALNSTVIFSFNENIQQGTNFNSISISGSGSSIGSKSISNNTLTINTTTPNYDTQYSIVLPEGAVKDSTGNPCTSYTLTFRTVTVNDTTVPYIISTVPFNNATGVSLNSTVSFIFNEDIIQGSNFNSITITGSGSSLGNKTINNNALTIVTNTPYYNTQYTINIPSSAVKDASGNNCSAYTLTFRTAASGDTIYPYVVDTNPDNGETDVSKDKTVTFTFNEDIYKGSNYNDITISGNGSDIDGKSISGRKLTIKTDTPYYSTHYTIYIPQGAVKDSEGNPNTPYSLTYKTRSSSGGSDDDDAPTLHVSPSSGTIPPNSSIIHISATDSSGIYQIGYKWDNSSTQIVYSSSVTVTSPYSTGNHTLKVYAKDDSSRRNDTGWKSYNYKISGSVIIPPEEYPGGPGIIVNPNVKTLKVELRNSNDRIKYAVGEEILYYIDYYNGTRSRQDQVEVVFNIPNDFTVTNAYQGTIQNNSVVWQLGTLQPLQSGRLLVKVKCTDSDIPERIVVLTAKINTSGVTQDSSMLQNMIFRSDASGYHKRYIIGYPDGSFKPERGITRAEFATMLVRLFDIQTPSQSYPYMNPYKDINTNKSTWAYDAIIACSREGLFGGYPDGTFKPDNIVTRAEFSAVLARKLNVHNVQTIWIHAKDLKNHWALDEMEQLIRMNIMEGYPDSTARPDRTISRAEAVTLLNRFTFRGKLISSTSSFWDVKTNHWAIEEIEEAARNHNYKRNSVGDEEIRY